MSRLLTSLLLLGLVCGCGTAFTTVPGDRTAQPPPPRAASFQERWWNWANGQPQGQDPVTDPDGRFCAKGQPGDVWFLAGTYGGAAERTCRVPAGQPIIFPLVNTINDAAGCAEFMAGAEGEATLDRRPLEYVREAGQAIMATEPDGAISSYLACGLWVRLDPPAPGTHTLVFGGSSGGFTTSVTYTLGIASPQQA